MSSDKMNIKRIGWKKSECRETKKEHIKKVSVGKRKGIYQKLQNTYVMSPNTSFTSKMSNWLCFFLVGSLPRLNLDSRPYIW